MRRNRGFTLLELMIVVALIGLATASVTLALRDDNGTRLEREAVRLAAMLEAARAQSRTSGLPVVWRVRSDGFEFIGLPRLPGNSASNTNSRSDGPRSWLQQGVDARVLQPPGATTLVLGPEPLIPAQRIALGLGEQRLVLATDGLGAFRVETAAP